MSAFSARVEPWRGLVREELERISSPVPEGIVLAVIQRESGGKAGIQAGRRAGDGSYALGLMQCIQSVVDTYNHATGASLEHAWLGSDSDESARYQVRVGVWLLTNFWKKITAYIEENAHQTPDVDRLAPLGDCAYAMGWGALRSKLDALDAAGELLTFEALAEEFPDWGRPANNPLAHARAVVSLYEADRGGPAAPEVPPSGGGFPAGCCCWDRRARGACPLAGAQKVKA